MLDLRSVRQRRVNRTVAIAGQVDRLLDALLVVRAVPCGHERDLNLLERPRPVLLLLAFDLDRQRFQRLFELLEQQDRVHAGASGEGAEHHLGGTHRCVITEHRRFVDGRRVSGSRLDIEESGISLFIPGDAFLVYVGHALPYSFPILFAAWLGFILAVILGSTNLYLVSRRYGRRLLEHRLARFLPLTPARLEEAEHWFRRYGPWALIFGRHIPGFPFPLTVAAGILELPYRAFVISVAVSSSIWAGRFPVAGAGFGAPAVRWLPGM